MVGPFNPWPDGKNDSVISLHVDQGEGLIKSIELEVINSDGGVGSHWDTLLPAAWWCAVYHQGQLVNNGKMDDMGLLFHAPDDFELRLTSGSPVCGMKLRLIIHCTYNGREIIEGLILDPVN
ncbi:MAG: hypothetical protein HQK60_14115 [Deltaproteobacteria bacterium]|nr:hypothetical protein [Deltaproteobacteria bacterium]